MANNIGLLKKPGPESIKKEFYEIYKTSIYQLKKYTRPRRRVREPLILILLNTPLQSKTVQAKGKLCKKTNHLLTILYVERFAIIYSVGTKMAMALRV